jgi:hypothetical protein
MSVWKGPLQNRTCRYVDGYIAQGANWCGTRTDTPDLLATPGSNPYLRLVLPPMAGPCIPASLLKPAKVIASCAVSESRVIDRNGVYIPPGSDPLHTFRTCRSTRIEGAALPRVKMLGSQSKAVKKQTRQSATDSAECEALRSRTAQN